MSAFFFFARVHWGSCSLNGCENVRARKEANMSKLLRLAALFGICLMLVFVSINKIQADDPTPVGVPVERNDDLSSGIGAAPEGAPAEGNDALSSDIAEPLGKCVSSELETLNELSVGVPHGEPVVNP
jgi:hypothetical protein